MAPITRYMVPTIALGSTPPDRPRSEGGAVRNSQVRKGAPLRMMSGNNDPEGKEDREDAAHEKRNATRWVHPGACGPPRAGTRASYPAMAARSRDPSEDCKQSESECDPESPVRSGILEGGRKTTVFSPVLPPVGEQVFTPMCFFLSGPEVSLQGG